MKQYINSLDSRFVHIFTIEKNKTKLLQFATAFYLESGDDLLSRAVSSQVPSALRGLTSVFGMGTGGALSPLSPEIVFICERDVRPGVFLLGIAFAILLCKTALLLLAVENVYVDRTFVRGISEIRNRFHDSSI